MKRKFLLLTLMCILMGGVSSLFAQETVTIDGTVGGWEDNYTTDSPFNTNYKYNTTQQFYYADELGIGKSTITHVSFYVETKLLSGEVSRNMKIYMVNTEEYKFSTKNPKLMSSNDCVFNGTVSFDAQQKWITIDLDTDFEYSGNNILLCTYDYTGADPNKNTNFDAFVYSGKEENGDIITRGLYKRYSTAYDPELLSTTTASFTTNKYIPDIKFTYSTSGSSETPAETPFPDEPALNLPFDNTTEAFNPFLRFTLGNNTTHYQILMGTGTEMTPLTDWVEKTVAEVDFQTSNLQPATTYIWKVVAKNDKNGDPKTTDSDTRSFTTKQFSYPGKIEGAYPNGEQGLVNPKFTWTFGSDTEEYQVIIDGEAKTEWTNPGSSTTGSYQTSGLSSGEHTWRIDAKNIVGTTTGTEYTFSVASLPDNVTPISPTNGATGVTSNVVRFQFAPNTEEYRLLYSDINADNMSYIYDGGTGNTWTSTGGATEMEFTIPEFGLGKTLYWAVDVKNALGQRSIWNGGEEIAIYSFTAASTLPVANVAPENGTNNLENPVLSWNFIGDATHYQVYIGTSENNLVGKGWEARGTVGTGLAGSGSYQTTDLAAATQYFWRVDVKEGVEGEVLEGEVWSFVTELEAPVAYANPAQVVPSFGIVYGGTTINWSKIETAQGYNVYLDGVKLNDEDELIPTNTNYYEIPANSMKLQYNMTGYTFNVEAVYEGLGSVRSEDVIVKVTGTGYLSATIYKNDYYNRLEGATITLSCTEDEFGNTYEEGNGRQYVLTTDSNGQYLSTAEGNERIQNGTYNVVVTKDNYTSYEGKLTFTNNKTSELSEILTSENVFDVYLTEVDFYSVKINLETNKYGNYHVYRKNGNSSQEYLGELEFRITPGNESVVHEYKDWANLGKGNYIFGVSKIKDEDINWTEDVEIRNYDVFEGSGDWNTTSCWRDKVLPSENADVYVLANATIATSKNVTVGTVNIETGGSLTINGSLTAGAVYNNAQAGALCINDGGQLRQSNQNLNGKFVMTVTPPTSWDESNIDGWQFIASPVEGVEFSNFVPANDVEGDYDLYQYDGDNDLWRNHKHKYDEGEVGYDFGSEFVLGTAYLAALQEEKDVIFSGIFNAATTHTFNVSHSAEKRAANFHLLGNPFTFDINIDNLKPSGLATGYAVMHEDGNDYKYLTEGTIPVGDGFFVFAKEATASLRYEETRGAKEATDNINIVARGEAGSNNVIINFAEGESFPKLEGFNKEVANIYVANAGNKYAIYNCESNVNEVELTFVAKQMGSYSLSFDLNGEFESVVLVDRLTGAETDMMVEDEYNFIATSEDMKNRFVVRFANGQSTTANSQFVYQSGDELIINAEGAIEIIDMMGRVVYSSEANVSRVNVSNFDNAAYVVRAINEGKVQKVVIY